MKKLLMFCAMLVFCIPVLVSCREQTPKSLLTAGQEVVAMMAEMTQSESYAALYNLPAAYSETIADSAESIEHAFSDIGITGIKAELLSS